MRTTLLLLMGFLFGAGLAFRIATAEAHDVVDRLQHYAQNEGRVHR